MRRNIRLLFMVLAVATLIGFIFNGGREAGAGSETETELATVCVDDWCGYVDDQGLWRITPRFTAADPFSRDGLAWVILSDERDRTKMYPLDTSVKKISLINSRGELVDPDLVFSWVKPFTAQGLAAAQSAKPTGGKGFINRRGQWIIEPEFAEVWSFADNGLAKVKSHGKSGFINTEGEWVIKPKFAFVWPFSSNGLAAACTESQYGPWGFINEQGQWVIEPQFEDAEPFAPSGLAKVKMRGKWGYITAEGQWVFEPQFDYTEVGPFGDNGLAKAAKNGKWGLINTEGQWVAEARFDHLDPFTIDASTINGLSVANADKTGFTDRQVRRALEPPSTSAGPSSDSGLPIVTSAGSRHYGAINAAGHWVLEPKFERLESIPFSAMGSDKINSRWVRINNQGQWLGEFLYSDWIKMPVTGKLMKGNLQVPAKKLYRTGIFINVNGLYRTGLDENPEEPGFRWEFSKEGGLFLTGTGRNF